MLLKKSDMLLEKTDMECEKMDLNENFYEIRPRTTWLISPLDFCPEFTNEYRILDF